MMKIEIKNIGKIENANIEIGDLTIFVGKNGTNKSYVAHTIYMVNKILNSFDNFYNLKKCFKLFIDNLDLDIEVYFKQYKQNEKSVKIEFEDEESDIFDIGERREIIYKFDLDDLEKNILNKIFNFILNYIIKELNKSFNVDRKIIETILFNNLKIDLNEIFKNGIFKIENDDENSDEIIVLYQLFKILIDKFLKCKIARNEYYFPASRTGFVLTFDEIVSGVLRDRFGGKPTATKLTEPTIDFISKFADIKSGKFDEDLLKNFLIRRNIKKQDINLRTIFEFIDKKIIFGNIVEKKSEENYTQFLLNPINTDKNIEMHLTSSSIVELLPLIIFLKHFDTLENKLLVIEEPEAHFHPQSQIEIARLLVILVNFGAKVLITTHSDYILNEINNSIKLSQLEKKKQEEYLKNLDLPKEVMIKKDKVKAYLFKEQKELVKVKELEIDKYGISNENFDDILDELLDRTEFINMGLKL